MCHVFLENTFAYIIFVISKVWYKIFSPNRVSSWHQPFGCMRAFNRLRPRFLRQWIKNKSISSNWIDIRYRIMSPCDFFLVSQTDECRFACLQDLFFLILVDSIRSSSSYLENCIEFSNKMLYKERYFDVE